jgi:hypothetical protein
MISLVKLKVMCGRTLASIRRAGVRDNLMKDVGEVSETLVYDNFDEADLSRRFLAH